MEFAINLKSGLVARLDWVKPYLPGLIGIVVIFSGVNAFAWAEKHWENLR
jgi:hypothetical protein